MTTHEEIPPPPGRATRPRMPPSDDERAVLLRAQPWGRLLTQLTAIALKRTGGRSLEDAEDLAQSAITDAYRSRASGGWDPEKGPLENFLVARVIGSAANERRRKRNVCEVWLDEEVEDAPGFSAHEKHFAHDAPAADEVLHNLRYASVFDEHLSARVAKNELATALLALYRNGTTKPLELEAATGRSAEDVRAARRSIRRYAEEITKELSAAAVSPSVSSGATGAKKVIQ